MYNTDARKNELSAESSRARSAYEDDTALEEEKEGEDFVQSGEVVPYGKVALVIEMEVVSERLSAKRLRQKIQNIFSKTAMVKNVHW